MELTTHRLLLRRWREADRDPFAALNADPIAMEHFPSVLTRAESDALVDRIEAFFEANGYGLWAVERLDRHEFVGFVGLTILTYEAHFTPATEVGWRLAREHWGHGFATEAARAAVDYGLDTLGVPEIVSVTATTNHRSMKVMERIGMTRNPADDFDHPRVPEGSPLRRHVLYRISREVR